MNWIDSVAEYLASLGSDFFLAFPIALFAGFALAERLWPARVQAAVRGWKLHGVLAFAVTLTLSLKAPLLWDEWLAGHTLIDARGLGHAGGAALAFVVLQLGIYGWHRALHRVDFLWRHLHQMHHSAERVDVFGAFLFHPLDITAFAFVGSLALVGGVGVTAPAAMAAGALTTFCSFFQHANLRTPRWLGFLLQRPESHALHHRRGVHAWNYADFPLWDLVFGTFRNPARFEGEAGFWDGASRQIGALLIGRDVSVPPQVRSEPIARAGGRPRARLATRSACPRAACWRR